MSAIVKRKRRESFTLDEMRSRDAEVMRAARRPGGVRIVGARGKLRFRLIVPSSALPD